LRREREREKAGNPVKVTVAKRDINSTKKEKD